MLKIFGGKKERKVEEKKAAEVQMALTMVLLAKNAEAISNIQKVQNAK